MDLPITYRMRNRVNGTDITISGTGKVSTGGMMRIDATVSEIPKDWNGIVVPCICSGPGSGEKPGGGALPPWGLLAYAPNGYRTSPGTYRLATLYDQDARPIAAVRATGVYALRNDSLSFEIDVETQTKPGSVISRLTAIDHYSFSIEPAGPGRAEVYAHYSLRTPDGEKVYGWTHIYYDFIGVRDELPQAIIGRNRLTVDLKGKDLSYTSHQQVLPASELGQLWR